MSICTGATPARRITPDDPRLGLHRLPSRTPSRPPGRGQTTCENIGQVILLNGPSSAGKTTLAKALQDRLYAMHGICSLMLSIDQLLRSATGGLNRSSTASNGPACPSSKRFTRSRGGGESRGMDHRRPCHRRGSRMDRGSAWEAGSHPLLSVQVLCDDEELQKRESGRSDRSLTGRTPSGRPGHSPPPLPNQMAVDTTRPAPERLRRLYPRRTVRRKKRYPIRPGGGAPISTTERGSL